MIYPSLLKRMLLVFFWTSAFPFLICAQKDFLRGKDLSTIKVDELSATDIDKLNDQLKQSAISLSQFSQMAIAKGMQPIEVDKLRDRLSKLSSTATGTKTAKDSRVEKEQTEDDFKTVPKPVSPAGSTIFGAQLFNSTSLSFEPNLRIATPGDYQLGPDDELVLHIFGIQEASFRLLVQAEGHISIPQVGQVQVAGLTIDDATKLIRQKLTRTVYKSLEGGGTSVSITLGKIRSIRITIIGAAKPGNYTVSSLTTLFNALYLCGGADPAIGSYREIQVIRNNKVYVSADLYQFLVHGNTRQNILLHEGDLVNIPVYKKRVKITGEVKRPGIFELLPNEKIDHLLEFAGGFTERAYTANIKIIEFSDKEKRIEDLNKQEYASYIPRQGDHIQVDTVLERFENRVSIKGAVYRPGEFELDEGLTLKTLIQKAEGLKEDAYRPMGLLTRLREDNTKESVSFSVGDVMVDPAKDIFLKREDQVTIASIYDLKDQPSVSISGEIRNPGIFPYKNAYTLRDLVFEAGGFTEAATPYHIEISHRVRNDDPNSIPDKIAEIEEVTIQQNLDLEKTKLLLRPYDLITVRRNPAYFKQKQMSVTGEVLYPGNYTIGSKKERISDVLKRAGGFTVTANQEAVSLTRNNNLPGLTANKRTDLLLNNNTYEDSVNAIMQAEKMSVPTVKIALNMKKILEDPNCSDNLYLAEGDIIDIPKNEGLVNVSGEIYFPTMLKYEKGYSLSSYINRSGGVTDKAQKGNIFVVNANGQVQKTKKTLFGLIKTYPSVSSGANIIVPAKTPKRRKSTGEILGIGGILISLMGVVVTTINSMNR